MHMERGRKSGENSEILVKIRNSSGCMIVKKKNDASDLVGSSKKEKKSYKMVMSDSGSSDENLTPPRRRVDPVTIRDCNGLAGSRKGSSGKSEFGRKRDRAKLVGFDEDRFVGTSRYEESSERKKNRLDVFEFDEYDGFDGRMMMRKRFEGGGRSSLGFASTSGSGRDAVAETRKKNYVKDTGRSILQDESESDTDSEEPIRVQGKNGVLKVMVSKKKKKLNRNFDHLKGRQNKSGSKLQRTTNKNIPVRSLSHSEAALVEEPWVSSKTAKSGKNSEKLLKTKRRKLQDSDSRSEDSEKLMKLEEKKVESVKDGKKVNPKTLGPAVTRDGKTRRGSGTEKQRLREQIKGMLLDANWTINYRPRKNRDYMDAVYVNPAGTAYWSIIKAYEALLKQKNDEPGPSKDDNAFASMSVEILNKLTRKTRNKIEKGATKRPKDISDSDSDCRQELFPSYLDDKSDEGSEDSDMHEEKPSSCVKQGGKISNKMYRESNSGLNSKNTNSFYHIDQRTSCGSNTHNLHGRKSNKYGRCTLLVRSSNETKKSEMDGFVPYSGKRTMLSWLIDNGTVQLSQKVKYMNSRQTRVMLEGWITREGIHCGCCSKILTVTKFELHAGSKLCQPFQNIYLDSGVSLLQCQIDAWNIQEDVKHLGFLNVDTDGYDPNDDTCSICGDGGDLICCDGCPSTFHQSCLGLQTLPMGDWHCPNCTCRICSAAIGNTMTLAEDETVPSLLFCRMCGGKYHKSCTREKAAVEPDSIGSVGSFCGQMCRKLFENLQKYLGEKNELEAGFSWSLIHRENEDSDSSSQALAKRIENNSKLAVALTIMDECFLPIIDRRSGINLVRNILYNCGSNFNRLNYSGFYTAILERGDEIISAASIRLQGTRLVEMPFIGTRHMYRRQGMCRRLFNAIEAAMQSLKIEKMVIPAIPDFMDAWILHFGFSPLEDSLKLEMRSLNMLAFPGIDMLQKQLLLGQENARVTVASESGVRSECFVESETANEIDFKIDEKPGIKYPVLDEKSISNVSQRPGELPKPSSEGEYLFRCSANPTAKKCENKSSGSPADVKNGEADANSYSQEIQVPVAVAASCDSIPCNETTKSVSDMNFLPKSDMKDDIPDSAGKALPVSPDLQLTRSCQDYNVWDAEKGSFGVAAGLDDQVSEAGRELGDEKSVLGASDESMSQKRSESDGKPVCPKESYCNEKLGFEKKPLPDETPVPDEKPSCNGKLPCNAKRGLDKNPVLGDDKSAAREKLSNNGRLADDEKPFCKKKTCTIEKSASYEKSEYDELNMKAKEVFHSLDGDTLQATGVQTANKSEADGGSGIPGGSKPGNNFAESTILANKCREDNRKEADAFAENDPFLGETTSESII